MRDAGPVRSGEELDRAALQAWLRGRVDGAEDGIEIEQFRSGHSNLTYLLRVGGRELVLRRAPLGPVAPRAHDMAREYGVLERLAPRYPPAPRVHLLCEDRSVIGAVFYLMERREGVILRRGVPPEIEALPDHGARVSRTLVDGLARLHAIDVHEGGLVALGRPEGFLERQVEGWAKRWERARTSEVPAIERLIDHLRRERPAPQGPTLVHNDYKLDNVMLAPGDPDTLAAVLDWEMATVGDPLADVGLSLVYWQGLGALPGDEAGPGAPGAASGAGGGWFDRGRFLERYAEASGLDLGNVGWYELLGIFKLAVILQQIYHRYAGGQTRDPRFRDFDRRVAALAAAGAARLDEGP